MFRIAYFLLAIPLLLVTGCGSDIAGKAGWPDSRNNMTSDGNGP
jgi:hypothetical protein